MTGPEEDEIRNHRRFEMPRRLSPRTLLAGGLILLLLLFLIFLARNSAPPTFRERALLQGKGPVAFSPDGATLATGHADKAVLLWDARTGESKRTLEAPGEVSDLAFSPDGRTVAAGGDYKGVQLWDAETGGRRKRLGDHSHTVLAFPPDGETVAFGVSDTSDERTVHLRDIRSGEPLRPWKEYAEPLPERPRKGVEPGVFEWSFGVSSVGFSPDGRLLATAHGGHLYVAIKIWDVRTAKVLQNLHGMGSGVTQVIFLPGGGTVAAGCDSGEVVFWDVRGGEPLMKLGVGDRGGQVRGVASIAVSPDGRILAASNWEEGTTLWDLRTCKRLGKLDGEGGMWRGVAFSPDGRLFAAASRGGVRLWDVIQP